jgi:hypothetical protein
MKIVTFGSCRQHPIGKYFEVSPLQEYLTYPHYSKEILQAIQFSKGTVSLSGEESMRCFRTGILQKKPVSQALCMSELKSSDIVVIEIASRISYEYNNRFVHHILTEKGYGFGDIENIHTRDIQDDELKEDIIKIKELLHPKPLIIVCHLYTRKTGKRYELIQALLDISNELNIPLINPSKLLEKYEAKDIYLDEPILAHYTEYGKQVIAEEYKKVIYKVIVDNGMS